MTRFSPLNDQLELLSPPLTTVERDYSAELACVLSCCHGKRYRLQVVNGAPTHPRNKWVNLAAPSDSWRPDLWTYGVTLPSRFGVPLTYEALVKLAYRVMRECGDHA